MQQNSHTTTEAVGPTKNMINFELETRVRTIIQQVLSALIRKITLFNDKIDVYDHFFVGFKQTSAIAEQQRARQRKSAKKMQDQLDKMKHEIPQIDIKRQEEQSSQRIMIAETEERVKEVEAKLAQIIRQNEDVFADLSKTKAKFLDYSGMMSKVKEEVSYKISKYLQDTSEKHTAISISAQQIKSYYFNANLLAQKQNDKYEEILSFYHQEQTFKDQSIADTKYLKAQVQNIKSTFEGLQKELADTQFDLSTKLKVIEINIEDRFREIIKNNDRLSDSYRKIDTFSELIEGLTHTISQNEQRIDRNILQTCDNLVVKLKEQMMNVSREFNKVERTVDRKIVNLQQEMGKLQAFTVQKMDFMRMQIQAQILSKTDERQKSSLERGNRLSSSVVEQMSAKMVRQQIQTKQAIVAVEQFIKTAIAKTNDRIEQLQDQIKSWHTNKKEEPVTVYKTSQSDHFDSEELQNIKKAIAEDKSLIKGLQKRIDSIQKSTNVEQQIEKVKIYTNHAIETLTVNLNGQIERNTFLLTKIRGDSIIRNEFNDRETQLLKKTTAEMQNKIDNTWKILPAMSECLNLLLSLVYDAEYPHSKFIQDNLPLKEQLKFTTCMEGQIYEYREKKKMGNIVYRHLETKKIDVLSATFTAYLHVWDQLFDNDLKNKPQMLPRTFYKKYIEKYLKKPCQEDPPATNSLNVLPIRSSSQFQHSKYMTNSNQRLHPQDTMNNSYTIRHKKTAKKAKDRQEMLRRVINSSKMIE